MSLKTFASQALADFQATAAIAPSSRILAEAMIEPHRLGDAAYVVELGPGTGAMTKLLLEVLPAGAKLLAFEINPCFIEHLEEHFNDPRLEVINASAVEVGAELRKRGWSRVDAVVSSLSFGFIPETQRHEILRGLVPFLGQRGAYTQFQYVHRMRLANGLPAYYNVRELLDQYFSSIASRTVWRNLPPAHVFTCHL